MAAVERSNITKPVNFSFSGMLQVTRIWNLLIIVLAQYFTAGFLIASPQVSFFNPRLFLLSFSTVLIAAAGYMINDYYDIKIDLINKPDRVVVGKVLKRRVIMVWHTALNFTGIAIGFYLSVPLGILNFFCAVLLWLYSNQLKRIALVGNITVALLTAFSIGALNLLFATVNYMVIAYSLFAMGFTLIREIIKDMEDERGDRTFGLKTLPVAIGMRKTKLVVYVMSILFVTGLTFLAYLHMDMNMTTFCLALFIPVSLIMVLLYRADTIRHYSRLSLYCKLIMLAGILSMIFNTP